MGGPGKRDHFIPTFPPEVERGDTLPCCFCSYPGNKCPFHEFIVYNLHVVLFDVILLFKYVTEHNEGTPKCKAGLVEKPNTCFVHARSNGTVGG